MAPTLLVADDSSTIRRLVDLTFSAQGITVVGVPDGQQAVDYLSSSRPDVALVSASLQKLDGFELADFIRTHPKLQGVPVLLMAGAFDPIDDERVRATGAAGVVHKPLEPQTVIARVKELIGLSQRLGVTSGVPASQAPPPSEAGAHSGLHLEEWFTETDSPPVAEAVGTPAAPPVSGFGPADAFAVLLAEEQGETAPPVVPQPIVELSDNMVERIADRVAERLMQSAFGESLRGTVHDVSERLVREEIQRIKASAQSQR